MDILKFFKNDEPTYVLPFQEYTDLSKQDKLKQQRKEAVRRYREKHGNYTEAQKKAVAKYQKKIFAIALSVKARKCDAQTQTENT